MRAYPRHQDNFDLITDFGLYPVFLALYVEHDSVVAQNAGAGVAGFDICWTAPIRIFHLTNPGVER